METNEMVQNENVEDAFVKVEKKRKTLDKKAKKKRKRIIVWSILGGVVLAVILLVVVVSSLAKNAPQVVTTQKAETGELISTLTVSGMVESEETTTYYAPVSLEIGEILISQGETVKKGEKVFTFEEQSFQDALRTSELQNQVAQNSYQSDLKSYEDTKAKFATANANITKYKGLVDAQEKKIKDTEATISDGNVKLAADLNYKIYKAQKENSDYQYVILNAGMLGVGQEGIDTYTKYIQSNNQQITDWSYQLKNLESSVAANEQQKALTADKTLLADYESKLKEAEAEKSSAEMKLADEFAAENISLNGELSTMSTTRAYEEMQKLTEGIVAEKDGIVTSIGGIEGQTLPAGTSMVSIASLDALKVSFSVSKNELKNLELGQKAEITIAGNTYEGTITKISHMATVSSNGAASIQAEAHIDNPDENIFLGLDAKMVITTANINQAMKLPVEAVNTDKTGDFVLVAQNGIVAKKYVTVGISSDEFIQILDGLTAEDEVITTISSSLEEGVRVTPISADLMAVPEETTE